MGRYDRYILSQLVVLFGFFSLVLISVYWINEAVDLFDSLIADGQTLSVFLEFTALTLPQIMLVVLQTAGLSALRLVRPVLVFGLIVGCLVGILGNILAPAARSQFIDRNQAVQKDLTGRFLREGQFIHPTDGLTVYIREITELGEFRDLFLQDRSDPGIETTYTASRALLVRSETGPRLVMFDGLAQTLDPRTQRLATIRFDDFTYDIGALIEEGGFRSYDLRELSTPVLLTATPEVAERLDMDLAEMRFAGHDRIARALFVIFPPLIAAACLMLGGFSRFGVWPQILLAVALVIPLQMIWNVAEATAVRNVELQYLAYAQPGAAALMTGFLLLMAMRRRRPLRVWRGGGGAPVPA